MSRTKTASEKLGTAVIVLSVVLAGAGTGLAQTSPCPSNFMGYASLGIGKSISCTCAPEQLSGSVWGSDRYTGDSSLCAAALHAGAVTGRGGTITVFREGSCPALVGSTRRGVTSRNWGPYEVTYAFKHPAPACVPEEKTGGGPLCPATMKGNESRSTSQPLECTCAPAQLVGSVWGSDIYTFDSAVCQAARHAGVVTGAGGPVTVFTAGRCASFESSARNGVTTAKWGAYDNTFAFRFPLPACADGAAAPKR